MKLKMLTAATMLVCAGSANAAIFNPTPGGLGGFGELFVDFVARNAAEPALDNSIAIDLGGFMNAQDFVDNNNAGTLSVIDGTTIGPNAQLSQFLADNSAPGFQVSWKLLAASSPFRLTATAGRDQGFVTTSTNALNPGDQPALGVTGFSNANNNSNIFVKNVNGQLGTTDPLENLSLRANRGEPTFTDAGNFNDTALFGFATEGLLGGSASFYWLGIDDFDNNISLDPQLIGSWSSLSDGTLTFNSVSAVPVPAAVWLFGSGLMGMVGVARRRKA